MKGSPGDDASSTLLDEGRRHLDVQISAYRDLDSKAIEVTKLGGAIIALSVALVGVVTRIAPPEPIPRWVLALAGGGSAFLVSSMVIGALSFSRSDLLTGVSGLTAALQDERWSEGRGMRFVVEVYDHMIRENKTAVEKKYRAVDWSVGLFVFGVILLGVVAFALLWRGA